MAMRYEGEVQVGDGDENIVASVTIGDLDDPGWLGQISSARPVEGFEPGVVRVELLGGDRDGWSASAYVDGAGALRGQAPFMLDVVPEYPADETDEG